MKKKTLAAFAALLPVVLSFLLLCGFTEGQKVYDDAGLFSDGDRARLEQACLETARLHEIDVILVTANTTGGKTATNYAADFYDDHAFGYDMPHGDGILLLIDMLHREVIVDATGDGARAVFNDARREKIIEEITPKLTDGDYAGACDGFLGYVGSYMERGAASGNVRKDVSLGNWTLQRQLLFAVIALGAATLVTVLLTYRPVRQKGANSMTYLRQDEIAVRDQYDRFVSQTVTHRHIPRDNDIHGGSGRISSSTFSSSGGFTHSSSSGHF